MTAYQIVWRDKIEQILAAKIEQFRPLHGGSVGEVYLATFADGWQVVAKVDRSAQPMLEIEGFMLRYLAEQSELLVPAVYHSEPSLLVMEYLSGESRFSPAAERHAAELLASLHNVSAPQFGFAQDTLISGLHQPNVQSDSWLDFFREQRLLHRGRAAMHVGRLPSATFTRLERFCGQLDRWLAEPERPSLIHGDVWTTAGSLALLIRLFITLTQKLSWRLRRCLARLESRFLDGMGRFGRYNRASLKSDEIFTTCTRCWCMCSCLGVGMWGVWRGCWGGLGFEGVSESRK